MSNSSALWVFFVTGALSVAIVLGTMGALMVLSQRKTLALHRKYAQDLLQAQEAERAWVAREVHDDAVQRLAAIANELSEVLPSSVPEGDTNRVEGIVGEVQDLGISLRKLAHGLHPSAIDKGGIIPALDQLAADMGNTYDLEVARQLEQPVGLPREHELALYRIAQESLRNVARHAGVKTATLTLAQQNGHVILQVKDRGSGDINPTGRTGIGLMSMRERARLAGGTLSIASRPGHGTTITARIPVKADGS